MGSFGTFEIVLILIVVVLLFGAKKIPDLMKGLGSGIKEFKQASQFDADDDKEKKSNELK